MPGYLGIPREKIRVVPLGSIPRALKCASRIEWSIHGRLSRRIAPEKGLHVLAEAYRIMRQSGELPEGATRSRRLHGRDCKPYLEAIQKHLKDAGSVSEFHYRGVLTARTRSRFCVVSM
jgi:hypothetical protein